MWKCILAAPRARTAGVTAVGVQRAGPFDPSSRYVMLTSIRHGPKSPTESLTLHDGHIDKAYQADSANFSRRIRLLEGPPPAVRVGFFQSLENYRPVFPTLGLVRLRRKNHHRRLSTESRSISRFGRNFRTGGWPFWWTSDRIVSTATRPSCSHGCEMVVCGGCRSEETSGIS